MDGEACPPGGQDRYGRETADDQQLRSRYRKASEAGKHRILDEMVGDHGDGRATARRMLIGPVPHGGGVPGPQVVGGQVLLRRPAGPERVLAAAAGRIHLAEAGPKRLNATASSCPLGPAAAPPSQRG